MAKLISRIGTNKEKFMYEIWIHSITMTIPTDAHIKVSWKRRNKIAETSGEAVMTQDSKLIEVNEMISMINTLYQKSSGKFLEKEAKLNILSEINGKSKIIGYVKLNLVDYCDTPIREHAYPIIGSKDKNAEICLSIKAELIDDSLSPHKHENESSSSEEEEKVIKIEENEGELDRKLDEINVMAKQLDELKEELDKINSENALLAHQVDDLKKIDEEKSKKNAEIKEKIEKAKNKKKILKEEFSAQKKAMQVLAESKLELTETHESLCLIKEWNEKEAEREAELKEKIIALEEEKNTVSKKKQEIDTGRIKEIDEMCKLMIEMNVLIENEIARLKEKNSKRKGNLLSEEERLSAVRRFTVMTPKKTDP
ncbi:unnamed protein product [Blepharisma stoltei]|uniref:C2 NT-type domain-containing protein n=1 Tax=Blepharisma stoltei TaxID=1481888 RepID=A0AAU9J0G2_9CILI|nr:unnamed protein product [Blepharisma stoltei]